MDASYGELALYDCTLVGAPICDWAVNAANMDSLRVERITIFDWINGISLSFCEWAEILLSELNGRQDGYGIKCSASSPVIQDNYINRFYTAIYTESAATPTVTNNNLACAVGWGLNNASINDTINAENNWWGGETGPYHPTSNPSGVGSPVSDNVSFSPWLDGFANRAPIVFNLLSPQNQAVLDTIPILDWDDATDRDCHDELVYTLYVSQDSTFSTTYVVPDLHGSSYALPESLVSDSTRHFWKVSVTDGPDSTWCAEKNWSFEVYLTSVLPLVRPRSEWHYRFDVPDSGWTAIAYDDSSWEVGHGPFGNTTDSTFGCSVSDWCTYWPPCDSIWLRKTFWVSEPRDWYLFYGVDDQATIYLNGVQLVKKVSEDDFSYEWLDAILLPASWFQIGDNALAVQLEDTDCLLDTLTAFDLFIGKNVVTSVDEDPIDRIPSLLALYPNFPNPFNPGTTIRYDLPFDTMVDLRIYDVLGRLVRTVTGPKWEKAGLYTEYWDGRNNVGGHVASGIYFYRLKAGSKVLTKKMVLIK
jgi:hypothetical protein